VDIGKDINTSRPGTVTGYIMHKKAKPGAAEDKESCKKANEKDTVSEEKNIRQCERYGNRNVQCKTLETQTKQKVKEIGIFLVWGFLLIC
jgi:hypothetical protein